MASGATPVALRAQMLGRDPGQQVKAADGGTTTYTYADNDVTVAVAGSGDSTKTRQLEYNSVGQLTSVCEVTAGTSAWPGGTCGQTNNQIGYWTKYTYTPLGQIVNVNMNAQTSTQQTRLYTYDYMGRLTSETNPESGETTYTYNTFPSACYNYGDNQTGNMTGKKDANGNTNCFHYDALHRLLDAGSTGSTNNYCKRLRYDATANGLISAPTGASITYVAGRLIEAETDDCGAFPPTPITDEWFSYDKNGNPTNLWEHTPNSGSGYYYPIAATYFANGMVNTLSGIPGLTTITYSLDYEGRINTVSANSGQNPVVLNGSNPGTTYNPASQVLGVNFGSGATESFTYDNVGRMNQYKYNVGGQTETANLTWNGTGTLGQLAITDQFNSTNTQTCNYTHDDLTRISAANCGSIWNQTFSYDPFGNITQSGTGSFQPTYATSTNRITQIGSSGTSYDADGNVKSDSIHSFAWDVYGTPATIDSVGTTYDALGRMVERNLGGGSYAQVVYTPAGAKLATMSGTTLQAGFVSLPAGAVAQYSSNGGFYYRLADWQGSTRVVTQEGAPWIFTDVAYSPFGFPYALSGIPDYSFTGMNQDTSAGLYDFPAREYEYQGRWPSPDPAGLTAIDPTNPQSWNRYAYVMNNPLAYADPSGMHPCAPNATGNQGSKNGNGPCSGGISSTMMSGDFPVFGFIGTSGGPLSFVIGTIESSMLGGTSDSTTLIFAGTPFNGVNLSNMGSNSGGSWLWTATKSFFTFAGGPGNKPTCAGQALRAIASELTGGLIGSQAAEGSLKAAGTFQTARAMSYAAGRRNVAGGIGLICPNCSSVFRSMMAKAELLGELSEVVPLVETSYAASSSIPEVTDQARNGGCTAAFPIF